MKTEAVLFDLDGTLIDSLALIVRTYRKVFEELKIPWEDGDVLKMIGLPLKDIARHYTGELAGHFEELHQFYYQREHDLYTNLFPGTLSLLDQLKEKGIRLGIVTSKGKTGAWRGINFTGLKPYMDIVVTAHDVTRPKPDPEPLLKALNYLGVEAASSILVGDSSYDILTGKNAGSRTLGVTWGLGSREELARLEPDGLLHRWDDLLNYL
jgi:pyrophosphatase PpaX